MENNWYKLKECKTLKDLEELEKILFRLQFVEDPHLNFYVTVEENGKEYYYTTDKVFGIWMIITDN